MSSSTVPMQGVQRPRISCIPRYHSSTGDRAVELAAIAGLDLDPWQAEILRHSLGRRADQKWAAGSVGVMVSRQNGKGGILEARELAGLFLLDDERLTIHSAHQYDTALEHFYRLQALIEETPKLSKRLKPRGGIMTSNGKESINLRDGSRLRLKARTTRGSGRGFSSDLLVLDEAMDLPESTMASIISTLSARPNPQIWYTGSAVDQWFHDNGVSFARVRQRGIDGSDPRLAYFEWSLDCDDPEDVPDELSSDPEALAEANPALGIRISPEFVETERRELSPRSFAVERLGVGDWPDPEGIDSVIPLELVLACEDEDSEAEDPIVIAFDTSPRQTNHTYTSVAFAGTRPDGKIHIEVDRRRRGTGWVVDFLIGAHERQKPLAIVCDERGPASSLIEPLARAGIQVTTVNHARYAQACGGFFDAFESGDIRHLGTEDLLTAIRGASKRSLGDAWAWDRKNSDVDITPLVACTLAWWERNNTRTKEPLIAWR